MTISDAAELKKILKALGFEVYRTCEDRVLLAERVRDNLIMDSGVAVGPEGQFNQADQKLRVSVVLRTQASHFPGASDAQLEREAHSLAQDFLARGYEQQNSGGQDMLDPGDPTQVLDTSHEMTLSRAIPADDLKTELLSVMQARRSSSDD